MGLLRRIRAILEQFPPERDPRDVVIEQQDREITRLQLETERRAGRRQAAPFAKMRPQGRGGRPGRRPGTRYGRQGHRACPAHVDEALAAPVPTKCPDCGGAVEVTGAATQ